jgi:membrane-associated protease RseP (regulator of RpoE activity)
MTFWTLLYIVSRILHLEKRGLGVRPAYFMFKSEWMKNTLDRISRKNQAFWKTLANIGTLLAFGMMILSIYLLADNLLKFFAPAGQASPIVPILPGVTLSLQWLPYFFAAAAVAVLTHEFAHGVAARIEQIPIKSAGIIGMLVFFGGFVEPDEEALEKARKTSKLRIIGAGSSTNFVTFLLVTLLLIGLFAPSSGVLLQGVRENSSAANGGLQQWDVIYAIDGTTIATAEEFFQYFNTTDIANGQKLVFATLRANVTVTAEVDSNGTLSLGVLYSSYYPLRIANTHPLISININIFLDWLSLITGSVAILNMLPAYPFDGDKFLYFMLEKTVKKQLDKVRIFYNAVCYGLLGLNIALTLVTYGLISI